MSRKLYIVDREPGPGGGSRFERTMFASPSTAHRNCSPKRGSTPTWKNAGWILVVDLDELPRIEQQEDGTWRVPPAIAYEQAERMLMHWTAEEERLRPALRDGKAPNETRQTKIDAALDALRAWRRQYEARCERSSFKPTRREVQLFHAISNLDDADPATGECMCGMVEIGRSCESWCDGGK